MSSKITVIGVALLALLTVGAVAVPAAAQTAADPINQTATVTDAQNETITVDVTLNDTYLDDQNYTDSIDYTVDLIDPSGNQTANATLTFAGETVQTVSFTPETAGDYQVDVYAADGQYSSYFSELFVDVSEDTEGGVIGGIVDDTDSSTWLLIGVVLAGAAYLYREAEA